ncbi:patatin-like phospholipase family protein [Pararhodonellum marinum]|uniref:patatin-like phospholipase family protein n=1 Tax=Pararhodonellum marinum TaxID=2755358 RepID=UPI001890287C|nr:patatin-like phospholipase family protein [Pararhodonellum marinum]
MWNKIFFSFPIQLLLLHLRKNIALVGIWVLLTVTVMQGFGRVLGIPYLFLDPEYLNEVSWLGFFLMGVGLCVFTMAFHMTTYMMDGARFKFLAVVRRPFLQFCINNGIIPLLFYIIYLYAFISFQLDNDHESSWVIFRYVLGFSAGSIISYLLMFLYFGYSNKDIFILFADSVDKQLRKTRISRVNVVKRYQERKRTRDNVLYYLDAKLKVHPVRQDLSRFERHQLLKVFDQNHLNLFLIQMVLIIFILTLGFFREKVFLQFPAAMSATLLLAILTMGVGAVSFWLREWATPLVFLALILFNLVSSSRFLNRPHSAFGLDYEREPAIYTINRLNELLHPDTVLEDYRNTKSILDNWRGKFPKTQAPKMVIITTSGGGQRAALWTMNVLQQAHIATEGKFFNHTQLISGASGGLIGAAFFRELYLQAQSDSSIDLTSKTYLDQISSDNLNPIIFTLLVNDLLIRNQYFEYNGRRYLQDRGFAFENQLNLNTKGVLDKPLKAYEEPERNALIPMLPITPMIVNDGRKLFISPHSMSYMGISIHRYLGSSEKSQAIDFKRFFDEHDADNLRFISALRMGATFPFITPNIQLPSNPQMEVMDAGLSDNFGVKDASRFMYIFRDWIKANTSGVILITIRDSEKFTEIEEKSPPTLIEKIVTPLKNIYANWDKVQTLDNEILYNFMHDAIGVPLARVEFEYDTRDYLESDSDTGEVNLNVMDLEIQRASLNWRLTAKEKRSILDNINSKPNRRSMQKLMDLFSHEH